MPDPSPTKIKPYLEEVSGAGNLDYIKLSIAAEAFHVLGEAGEGTTAARIRAKAWQFGWSVSEAQVDEAISYLQNLGLIQPTVENWGQ